ncbi:MAG: SseB family protein [Marvinbryantia sp.]|jgi:hypothetical protein
MTNTKQEELKKLLVSVDFKEETYAELVMQELIILKNSSATMKNKETTAEKAAEFFGKREEFFEHLIKRRLQTAQEMFVIFSKATNLPYFCCDPESANDQVWLFSDENFAKKTVVTELAKKQPVSIVKLENKQFLSFYLSLFTMGVNELQIDRGVNTVCIALDSLVKKPDFSGQPVEKRPVENPQLILTAAYFAQENSRPKEERDIESMRELEEEMIVNLERGRVVVPVLVPEGTEKPEPKDVRIPYLKMQNGDAFQPVCSDFLEFQKFNKENKFRAIVMDGGKIGAALAAEAKGMILNPASVRLMIPKQKL